MHVAAFGPPDQREE